MTHHSDFDPWQGPSTDTRIKSLEASNAILRKAAFDAGQRADRAFKRGAFFASSTIGIFVILNALGVL